MQNKAFIIIFLFSHAQKSNLIPKSDVKNKPPLRKVQFRPSSNSHCKGICSTKYFYNLFFNSNKTSCRKNAETYFAHQESLTISAITYYEITRGLKHKAATIQLRKFKAFSATCERVSISLHSKLVQEIYADLCVKGITIGDHDLLIAGIAVSNALILTTNNENLPNYILYFWKIAVVL